MAGTFGLLISWTICFISGMQIVTAQSQGGPVPPPGLPRPDPPYFQGFYNSASLGPNSLTMSADLLVTDYVPFDPDSNITRSRQFELARILLQREMACTKSCTGHGLCDNVTKFCVCEYFWTQNPFKEWHRPAAMHNNCDWNVFVVIAVLISILFGFIILSILLHGLCRRYCYPQDKITSRRYRLVPEDDEAHGGRRGGLRIKRTQLVDSDEDENEAVFEAKNPQFYGTQAVTQALIAKPGTREAGADY